MTTAEDNPQFEVTLFSFGFKHGMPEEANYLWDVRFLPNPYWEESLRHLNGMDEQISSYVLESDGGREFLDQAVPLLRFLISQNREAGKAGLRIAIGCTGGHHRSVAVVERVALLLQNDDIPVTAEHRDLGKG